MKLTELRRSSAAGFHTKSFVRGVQDGREIEEGYLEYLEESGEDEYGTENDLRMLGRSRAK